MKRLAALLAVLIIPVILAACGQDGVYGATVITAGEHTYDAARPVDGELIVTGGRVRLGEGSRVTGSLYVIGGNVEILGQVAGDVYALDGAIALGPRATIGGAIDVANARLDRAPSATVAGGVRTGTGVRNPFRPAWADRSAGGRLLWLCLLSAAMASVALLWARSRPIPLSRVAACARRQPVVAGALGLLAGIVALVLAVFMAFTLVLLPVAALALILLAVGVLAGWVALGVGLGRWAVRALRWRIPPPVDAALGTFAVMLAINCFGLIPLVGEVIVIGSAVVGLGAVLLTRCGLREFVPGAAGPSPAPVAPEPGK